jgi:cyclin B
LDSTRKNYISHASNKLNSFYPISSDINGEIKKGCMDVEMKIENENLNDSFKNSINEEKINKSIEKNDKIIKCTNYSYNNSDNSYGDSYSTSNSNVENEKNKQRLNLVKEENECGINVIQEINDMQISQDKENEEKRDVQSVNEYKDEILNNLIEEEKKIKYEINPNYFQYQTEINQDMRSILIDWLIDVHNKLSFKEETIYIAIYIMDSYLSKKFIQRKRFQLLGITSLILASKLNEIYIRRISDYVFITDKAYTVDEIKYMEEDISKTLNFKFLVPSSLSFYEIISEKIGIHEDSDKFRFGEFLIQSFLIDFRSLYYSYSTISCACCYIIMKFNKMKNYQISYNNQYYSIKYNNMNENRSNIVKDCAKNICAVITEMFNSKLQSTIKKYSKCKFYDDISKVLGMSKK